MVVGSRPEDAAHRLITDRVPQMLQGTGNPVISPGAILLRQTDDQGLQLLVDAGTSWRFPLLGAVKLLCNQLPVPGQNGVGCNDRCHLLQRLLPQLLADLGQRLALLVAQPHALWDLLAQDAILCPPPPQPLTLTESMEHRVVEFKVKSTSWQGCNL